MSNMPTWRIINGWRELCSRIFEGLTTQFNVTPAWLVNPTTNRRLKLDLLYPEIGVAVRFKGVKGKKRRRLSIEEEAQQQVREAARAEVCREHGVELITIDARAENFSRIFQQIDVALSRAGQHLPNRDLKQKVKTARSQASTFSLNVEQAANLSLYADLWDDRQYQIAEPDASTRPAAPVINFAAGMEVEHTAFGPGVVVSTAPSNGDTLITVDFVTAGLKTLAASLVVNKLMPRQA